MKTITSISHTYQLVASRQMNENFLFNHKEASKNMQIIITYSSFIDVIIKVIVGHSTPIHSSFVNHTVNLVRVAL